MPLSVGTRLGPYEIVAAIGAGGMGEVYKARDTRLDRTVAIKVLPQHLAADAEARQRLEREARAVSSLNHPNICVLHDIGHQDGIDFLVMEYLEGETLAERLARGALAIEQALRCAIQIADALDKAHRQGVTHRDLKPGNIILTKTGAKLLDFGLAKVGGSSQALSTAETVLSASPHNAATLTQRGTVLGTFQYMSPEQIEGHDADARTDIFAFGAVLYEMLTGRKAFEGKSQASLMAAILAADPPQVATLQPMTPATLDRAVKKCLAKDPDERWQTAADLEDELKWIASAPESQTPQRANSSLRHKAKLPWAVAAALLVALVIAVWGWWHATRPGERPLQPLVRLDVDLGPDAVAGSFITTAISPDGTRLVFPTKSADGKQMLATRLLEQTKPALLSGTENGRDPFFSPDGKWIGFFADGKMKKISVLGGAPVVLCDALNARGANWGDDGNIIVALNVGGGLSRVPAEGGTPQPITRLQGATSHRWPQPLPGSEAVLFTVSFSVVAFEDASIAAWSLKTGEIKILVRGGYFGRYLPTGAPSGNAAGHLVYVHEGVLFAVPFDPARLELRGAAVPLLEDLAADPNSGAGQFSFSGAGSGVANGSGTFVYRTGKVSAQSWPVWWLDNKGKTQPLIAAPGFYVAPRFSPDSQRLALSQISGNNSWGIFVYDWQRDTMSRLALDTQPTGYPTWSPDGKHIAFQSSSAGGPGLGWARADGAGEAQRLLDSKNRLLPYSFFPDGRRLAYTEIDPDSGSDLWTLPFDVSDPDHPKPGKPELFLRTPSNEVYPAVSPDGHWIAYQSDDSGRYEVYVRPFPISPAGSGGKWQISNAGGRLPIWSRNGRGLFFQNLDSRIMVTDYEVKNESFVPAKPHLWSDLQLRDVSGLLNYDLAPDGKRFAVFPNLNAAAEEKGTVHLTFLQNFFDELRRRAPAGGK